MPEPEQATRVVRFGVFEVDLQTAELRKQGVRIRLPGQSFQVLEALLLRPGELVTREELRQKLWPADTFGDFEHGLNAAVNRVREALGDSSDNPRFVETLPRRGYRFIAPVSGGPRSAADLRTDPQPATLDTNPSRAVPGVNVEPEAPAQPEVKSQSRKRLKRWLLPGAAILVVGAAAGIWYLRRSLPPPRISEFTQITHDGRQKGFFGSDGTRLYFNRFASSQPIYQVAVTGGEPEHVPVALPNPWLVDVSREDSSLLVIAGDGNSAGLWRVAAVDKSLHRLAEGDFESAAWSADGKSVVYSLANGEIYVIRSDGSGARRIASMKNRGSGSTFVRFAWSPDGKKIRFNRNNRIYEVSADGSRLHEFLPNWRPVSWQCCGQWTPDGKLFLFLEWDNPQVGYSLREPFQLWGLDERVDSFRPFRTEPFQLTFSPTRWGWPFPAKDGKKVYIRGDNLRGELVRLDPQSHQLEPYLRGISAEGVTFSRDGRFVAYVTFPEGILWKANGDGSDPVQLTVPPIYAFQPNWSPDGTQIVFADRNSPKNVMYEVSSQGGSARELIPGETRIDGNPNWSSDGEKIVFGSGQNGYPDPKGDIRILDLASLRTTTIPGSVGQYSPVWSPDGRFVAAQSVLSDGMKIFDVATQLWSELPDKQGVAYPAWSRDSKIIYYLRAGGEGGLFRIRVPGGQAERIHDMKDWRWTWSMWMGLDPTDAPLLLRDTGSDEIYALTLEEK